MKNALPLVVWFLCVNLASADPPSDAPPNITALVQEQLLQPLSKAQAKRKRFSRAAPMAAQRRVRVLMAHTDARGQQFVRFAVDERIAWDDDAPWEADTFIGCAYPAQRKVFIQRGNQYLPASSALGQNNRPDSNACRPASEAQLAAAAQLASAQ